MSPARPTVILTVSKPQSFEMAKNIIAGLAGMEVDKLV